MSGASADHRPATPWSPADLTVAVWPVVFGVALLAWSWWEASGSPSLDDQTGWVVIAVVATGIAAFGMSAWVRAGRRAVRERREHVLTALEELTGAGGADLTDPGWDTGLVTYPNAQRYHRADCALVQGKRVQPLSARTRGSKTARPCEMCEP